MRTGLIVTTALLAALAAGCRNSQKGAYAAKGDTMATTTTPAGQAPPGLREEASGPYNVYPQITVEYAIRKYVAVSDPVVTKGDVMKVVVPTRLLADESENTRIQYRFIFLGTDGTPLRDQADWRYHVLEARQQVFLSGTSTDTAADWRMEIRRAR